MLITVTGLKGAPGVTTLAHALAVTWPVPVRRVLVEADPFGGVLAVRFALAPTPGLVSMAATHNGAESVWSHTQALPDGLAVVTAPAGAGQTRTALCALLSRSIANTQDGVLPVEAGTVAVVDCGRLCPGSPAMPLIETSDVTLVVVRARPVDLVALAATLPMITEASRNPALVLVGNGFTTGEVTRELGVPVTAHIPWDPRGAARLGRRHGAPRWTQHGLIRAIRVVAAHLDTQRGKPAVDEEMLGDPEREQLTRHTSGRFGVLP